MAETRYEYLLNTLLGSKIRTKESGTTGKMLITDWTPNNIKTFIVTPNSVIVEYHVINDKTKKHASVNKKVFTIDLKSCTQSAQSKSVLKILTEPRVLSAVEEIIFLPVQKTQTTATQSDWTALCAFVTELKRQQASKAVLRFPRLRYVTIVDAQLSAITQILPMCSTTRVVFTEELRKNKAKVKILYENTEWWQYGITGFAPLRPEYYELDKHPEIGTDEKASTAEMVLHNCFTAVAKPYIKAKEVAEENERKIKEFNNTAERLAKDIPQMAPLLTESVARNTGITCLSACVAPIWKEHSLYKEYVFNKLLLNRKHINRIMQYAEQILTQKPENKHAKTLQGLQKLAEEEQTQHVYKRTNVLNSVSKIAQYAYTAAVPKQLQELCTLYTHACVNGTGALCAYVGWISGMRAITAEMQSNASDSLAKMTYDTITVNTQHNIAESLDTPVTTGETPTTEELEDFYVLSKALLYTMHYIMFELQAEYVIDRRCGSPEEVANALRSVQKEPGNVPAAIEVARIAKGQSICNYRDKEMLDDTALNKSIANVHKRGITDPAQTVLLACGINAYIHKTKLGTAEEDIVPCYVSVPYKEITADVQTAYNAIYREIAKVYKRTPQAVPYVAQYNLETQAKQQ